MKQFVVPSCFHAVAGRYVPFETVTRREFICDVASNCPTRCACYTDDMNAISVPMRVICTGKKLNTFRENVPSTTQILYFDGNNMTVFSKSVSTTFYLFLVQLFLSDSSICHRRHSTVMPN